MIHTSEMSHYAVVIGRNVMFMARPERTRQKKYRQPIIVKRKRFKNKAEAEAAKNIWEGKLI